MEMTRRLKAGLALRALVIAAAVSAFGCTLVAGQAQGAAFGELRKVGTFGPELEHFTWPSDLAVDPADNSVYVLDDPGAEHPGPGPSSFRVQKFDSSLGAPVASVSIPTPPEAGHLRAIFGMAVDSHLHRLYVLEGIQTSGNNYAASEIVAYSTQQEGITLPLAEKVPSGVFYTFPAAKALNALEKPQGIAVDPTTDDLIVLGGEDNGENVTVVQRIHASGPEFATGAVSASFADFENAEEEKALSAEESNAHGVAVGADGAIYLVDHNLPNAPSRRGIVKLSSDFTSSGASAVVLRADSTGTLLTGGKESPFDLGPQVAVAPGTGGLIYAAQEQKAENNTVEPRIAGSYEVRGMSPADGSQQVVFGGGTAPHCLVASSSNAIAAGSGGVVYALDEGGAEATGIGHSSFGFDLVEFGPNGSECPSPTASFKVNGSSGSGKVVVEKGSKVVYEAESAGLNGEKPTELNWDLDGSGQFKTKSTGTPPGLVEEEEYFTPGVYPIGLAILLEHNGNYGNPPPVTRQVEVIAAPPKASFEASTQTPKPEEAVTFNGELSSDPTGLCAPGKGCQPTNQLKEYTWKFGDGQTVIKKWSEGDTYSRGFANASHQSRQESVTLTVTNEEGVQSAPVKQELTIQGTPEPTTTTTTGSSTPPPSPVTTTTTTTPITTSLKPTTSVKPLTNAQKLAKAEKACNKIKAKKKRAACVAQAKRKYGPKPKSKKKRKK